MALLGPTGAPAGARYVTVGTVVSGAGILPEFLPTVGRRMGESLPTGAGVQEVWENSSFPDAPIGHPLAVLGLYAGIGCLVVLVTTILPHRGDRMAEFLSGGRERVTEGSTVRL